MAIKKRVETYKCDACGKTAKATVRAHEAYSAWHSFPPGWLVELGYDGAEDMVCSVACFRVYVRKCDAAKRRAKKHSAKLAKERAKERAEAREASRSAENRAPDAAGDVRMLTKEEHAAIVNDESRLRGFFPAR